MPPQTLRPYQLDGLARILDAYRQGARSVLAVAPTGSGKTTLFGSMVHDVWSRGGHALINVHRRELAAQASNRLTEFGTDFGVIMAGEPSKPYARVQIASVQTLVRRSMPRAGLVVNDEAHLSTAATWAKILDNYSRARILGVTATPWRLSGKPLAGAYDACVVVATPAELCAAGHLCPYVGFSYKTPDLSSVKTTAGEYNERQAAAVMSESVIVGDIVAEWLAHARELSTVVFAVTVEHSKTLAAAFRAAGVSAEHLDGTTGLDARRAILARVERGETRVLCNVGVAVEGLDIPRLKCCVLARPTKSLARAIQMMGRVRRPWNNQVARIHDHALVIKTHGLPDAERDYRLDAKPEKPPSLTQCEHCFALYSGGSCLSCGKENEARPSVEREIVTIADAEKIEFSSLSDRPGEIQRAPVDVKWSEIGKMIEGVFKRSWEEPSQYGPQKTYLVAGAKRDYRFHGTTRLNVLMAKVKPEQRIRVTYTGETPIGTKRRKEFKVEVNDAAVGLSRLEQFVADSCAFEAGASAPLKVIYQQWTIWCTADGTPSAIKDEVTFAEMLTAKFPSITVSGGRIDGLYSVWHEDIRRFVRERVLREIGSDVDPSAMYRAWREFNPAWKSNAQSFHRILNDAFPKFERCNGVYWNLRLSA